MKPFKFATNEWSQERYDKNELLNSDGIHNPVGMLGGYKTNSAEEHFNILEKFIKNKRVGVDVGCRWGSFTVQLHKLGFQHVHMIEMRDMHYQGILYNVDMSRASLYNCAAMDKSGNITRSGKVVVNSDSGNVKAIAVDDLNLNNVDFIKIDVDGPDRLVLKGCLNTIKKCNPVIYIEYGTEQLDWEKRYNNNVLTKSEDLWGMLKPHYKEYTGLENNIILVPTEK